MSYCLTQQLLESAKSGRRACEMSGLTTNKAYHLLPITWILKYLELYIPQANGNQSPIPKVSRGTFTTFMECFTPGPES